jgi:Ca2+-binding RTX toxin-like protein
VAITTQPGAGSTDLTTLLGTELADTFTLTTDSLSIEGLAGADTISAAGAVEKITVDSGGDGDRITFSGELASSSLSLGEGNDVLTTQNLTNVTANGGFGVDSITVNRDALTSDIKGRSGNDRFSFGQLVTSTYIGGDKDDDSITVTGLLTSSTVRGGNQNDTLTVGAVTSSTVRGDNNNDRIDVSGILIDSFINGNAGNDSITLAAGVTSASGSKVFGGSGVDTIVINATTALEVQGNKDDDDITTSTDNKFTVLGGAGNDAITHTGAGSKSASLLGGAGNDSIDIAGGNGGSHVIDGGDGKDTIVSLAGADSIDGGIGNDAITTGNGNDVIFGRAGTDSFTINGTGNKKILGGSDNDTFTFSSALGKNDTIKGETGTGDKIEYFLDNIADADFTNVSGVETFNGNGVVANGGTLSTVIGPLAQAAGITTVDFKDVDGTDGTDDFNIFTAASYTSAVALTISGSSDANLTDNLTGGAGADTISSGSGGNAGAGGGESLTGGDGNDLFKLDSNVITAITDLNNGDNFQVGATAAGLNTMAVITDFTAGATTSNVQAAANAVMTANGGVDFISMAAASSASTGGFTITGSGNTASTMTGSGQADAINTGTGADSITGGGGADVIDGGGGADILNGGTGNDLFTGEAAEVGAAALTVTGGTGTDTLRMTNAATSTDFTGANQSYTQLEELLMAADDGDAGADNFVIKQDFFSLGAVNVNITGLADADNDTFEIEISTTNWDAAAEATAGAVNVAGEWNVQANVGGSGVLTYFNEVNSGVTTVTLNTAFWSNDAGPIGAGNLILVA